MMRMDLKGESSIQPRFRIILKLDLSSSKEKGRKEDKPLTLDFGQVKAIPKHIGYSWVDLMMRGAENLGKSQGS